MANPGAPVCTLHFGKRQRASVWARVVQSRAEPTPFFEKMRHSVTPIPDKNLYWYVKGPCDKTGKSGGLKPISKNKKPEE